MQDEYQTKVLQSLERIENLISHLIDEEKKTKRAVDTVQKSTDLVYQDRQILEDVVGGIGSLRDILLKNREHQETVRRDLKADVSGVTDKVEEVKKDVVEIVVDVSQNVKEVISPQNFFQRLFRQKKKGGELVGK